MCGVSRARARAQQFILPRKDTRNVGCLQPARNFNGTLLLAHIVAVPVIPPLVSMSLVEW